MKAVKMHEYIANARADYLHKLSTEFIKNHDVIGMEDLQISNMLKNRKLAKAISEVSWSQFRNMLEYKENGTESKSFLSQKLLCLAKHHDRDVNSGLNLRNKAIHLLTVGTMGIAPPSELETNRLLYLGISHFK
ncbi:UNVERIFIED_ORG: IS605 OrfB family transposase [Bacillus proteolyticus]